MLNDDLEQSSSSPEPQVVQTSPSPSLNEIVNPSPKGSSNAMIWGLILVVVVFLVGGFLLYSKYLTPNEVTEPETTPQDLTELLPIPEENQEITTQDDTATLQKELDATRLQDTSNSDSATLDVDINQLQP